MAAPKISVIVPVYNSEKYIVRCLESLAGQSAGELEVVLVDDHGTDSSIAMASDFAAENMRQGLSFIFTETPCNSGPGAARNAGIKAATGDWVCFVDSDDTVSQDFCRKLLETAGAAGADIACCDIDIDGDIRRNACVDNKRSFLKHYVSYFTTWIYRRQMLIDNEIVFPGTRSAEDSCFLACAILASEKIAQIHEPLYHYLLNGTSVSQRRNRKRAFQRIASFRTLRHWAKAHKLYRPYLAEIEFIILKKGWALALRDLIAG